MPGFRAQSEGITMSTIRRALACAVLTVGALAAAPAAAQASPNHVGLPPNGNFYLFSGLGYSSVCDFSPKSKDVAADCRTYGEWSVKNRGYAGAYDDIKLHYYLGGAGAAFCLKNMEEIPDLESYTFNEGAWSEGRGTTLVNNILSVQWANC
jgi:hypothetical protein